MTSVILISLISSLLKRSFSRLIGRSHRNAITLLALLSFTHLYKILDPAMNSHILAEVQKLRLYLQRHPQEAAKLAVNYLEDYLVLLNEFKLLQNQINHFQQSKTPLTLISLDPSIDTQLTLEQKFRVEILKRSLSEEFSQSKAKFWAVEYLKFLLHLNESYLEIRAELISLSASKHQPSLPHWL